MLFFYSNEFKHILGISNVINDYKFCLKIGFIVLRLDLIYLLNHIQFSKNFNASDTIFSLLVSDHVAYKTKLIM